jgi:thiamine-phosphate pyrophosphorylase
VLKLIIISKEGTFLGEAEIINQLMATGNFNFHLRKKNLELSEIRKLIYKINPAYYTRIVIHQHFKMEKEFSFCGIHLPEVEKENYEPLKTEGHTILSTSIHDLNEYQTIRKKFQYVFFSPVFSSISKPGYNPIYSRKDLLDNLTLINNKNNLIGLGGVNEKNITELKQWGFGGAAFLGSVWENKSPVKYFQAVIKSVSGESK